MQFLVGVVPVAGFLWRRPGGQIRQGPELVAGPAGPLDPAGDIGGYYTSTASHLFLGSTAFSYLTLNLPADRRDVHPRAGHRRR